MKKNTQLDNLRKKDSSLLSKELVDIKASLVKARVDLAFGRLANNSHIATLRKNSARIATILREKETSNA